MGVQKLSTSSYHAMGNGGTERVNHIMAQMLACVVNEKQGDWDEHLLHVKISYNSVDAATGSAPNEIHLKRLLRFSVADSQRGHLAGNQSLERDQLVYYGLTQDHQY